MATKSTLSATAREIINALKQNKMIICHFIDGMNVENYIPFTNVSFLESDNGDEGFYIVFGGSRTFSTDNLDDYPYYISDDNNNPVLE